MDRKQFLKYAAASSLSLGLSACVKEASRKEQVQFEQEHYWKMLTTWPPNFPILGEACEHFARNVERMSGGRMRIKVFGAGELVPALESFEAVKIGVAEIGNGASYYWAGKVPSAQFFASVPFGMNAQMLNTWLLAGGGMQLWEEIYAPHNLIPMVGGNTGMQMGGWFNREIRTVEDLKGLKIRMPGLGGKVISRAGGTSVLVAGGEIYTNLERGIIDATEWLGPYHDYLMGFHKIAKYYYTPGWHESGTSLEYIINKEKFEALDEDLQSIIRAAASLSNQYVLSSFEYFNAQYLSKLMKEEQVEIRKWPKSVLELLRKKSAVVIKEEAAKDEQSSKIYRSYSDFMKSAQAWSALSEKAYFQMQ